MKTNCADNYVCMSVILFGAITFRVKNQQRILAVVRSDASFGARLDNNRQRLMQGRGLISNSSSRLSKIRMG